MVERAFTTAYEIPKAKLAYNWEFDQHDRHSLEASRPFLPPEKYRRQKNQLEARITENLKSEVRERLCTIEYQTTYTLENSRFINSHHDEPFVQIIKRGITYRGQNGSTDQIREQAELIGFERIEQIMNQITEPTTVVSISPRGKSGSVYQHNFFDIFQRQEDGQIQMTRFTSTASLEDFQKASQKLNPLTPQPTIVSDAYFLAHPIETTASVEEILETIELDNNAMEKEYVESIIEKCLPVILAYVANPSENGYKATVNLADILAGKKQVSGSVILNSPTPAIHGSPTPVILDLIENLQIPDHVGDDKKASGWNNQPSTRYQTLETITYLSSLPVRPVATGCGISGSASKDSSNSSDIWSVSDFGFGEDQFGTRKIHCEECGTTYQRDSGKLEKNCRKCGGTKGIAC